MYLNYFLIYFRLSKRSWFGNFMSSRYSSTEHCDELPYAIAYKNRTLNSVKSELVHAFLSVSKVFYWSFIDPLKTTENTTLRGGFPNGNIPWKSKLWINLRESWK